MSALKNKFSLRSIARCVVDLLVSAKTVAANGTPRFDVTLPGDFFMRAIQDFYPAEFAHCFGCGSANPAGHHLKSYLQGDTAVARFTPDPKYSGGVPDHIYGGLVASLLDCHGAASAAAYAYRADGREMGDTGAPIRFVTGSLKIDFKRPTPLGVELEIRGRLSDLQGRKAWIHLELLAGDSVCATGEMLAIRLKD